MRAPNRAREMRYAGVMNIIHVIAPGPAGGAESSVRSLALGLREAGHQVEVAALTADATGDHPFVESLRAAGVRVTDIRCGSRDYLGEAESVGNLLRSRGADIVHSHVYRADGVSFLAANHTGTAHVATLHGYTATGLKQAVFERIDGWILRRCAAVVCVASNTREIALAAGVDARRIHVVPNGYEPVAPFVRDAARMHLDLAPDAKIVGWVGRMSPEKGADLLLDAIAEMRHARDVQAVLVGDGPERSRLEAQARRLGIAARVRFLGRVDDAGRFLSAFDVLALSSRTEASPMVLLEAMAASVPVVAFRVGGVGTMVSPESALVVNPADVNGMARALEYTFACPRSATARARVAHATFGRRFSAATTARRISDIYASVVTRAQSGPTDGVVPAIHSLPRLRVSSTSRQAGM